MHLFGHDPDHDYYFRLLREEDRDVQDPLTNHCRLPTYGSDQKTQLTDIANAKTMALSCT